MDCDSPRQLRHSSVRVSSDSDKYGLHRSRSGDRRFAGGGSATGSSSVTLASNSNRLYEQASGDYTTHSVNRSSYTSPNSSTKTTAIDRSSRGGGDESPMLLVTHAAVTSH